MPSAHQSRSGGVRSKVYEACRRPIVSVVANLDDGVTEGVWNIFVSMYDVADSPTAS